MIIIIGSMSFDLLFENQFMIIQSKDMKVMQNQR